MRVVLRLVASQKSVTESRGFVLFQGEGESNSWLEHPRVCFLAIVLAIDFKNKG